MSIKVLMFDVDGTLLDTEIIYFKYWKEASVKLGYHISDDVLLMLRSCDSSVAKKMIYDNTGDVEAYQKIRMLRKELMQSKKDAIVLKHGVLESFLNHSKQLENYRLVIVTSAKTDEKMQVLSDSGLLQLFERIITTSDVKRGKPFPDVYEHACSELGVQPSECVAFEDSPNGVDSAIDAGIKTFFIPDLTKPDRKYYSKCMVVDNIGEAFDLLETIK